MCGRDEACALVEANGLNIDRCRRGDLSDLVGHVRAPRSRIHLVLKYKVKRTEQRAGLTSVVNRGHESMAGFSCRLPKKPDRVCQFSRTVPSALRDPTPAESHATASP